MRWSGQYGLRWPNVDLTATTSRSFDAKGGKDQRIPMTRRAARRRGVRALAPKSEFVCPGNDYDQHRGWWLAVLKAAALGDFHWHYLRQRSPVGW